jgi:phosphoadenosine phosphosulfate reductase
MLIPSDRHTREDLECWRELEAGDQIHGATLDRKIDQALDRIRSFAAEPCYCSVSWGKDSVVVAHLVSTADSRVPLGHLVIRATTAPNPDSERVRDSYLRMTSQRYAEVDGRETKQHDFGCLASAFGFSRSINGVRAAESGERRLSRLVHGVATEGVCRPIIDWTTDDVFGYLARFALPVHPAYAMLGGGRYDRQWIRVASLGGERGRGIGRAEWEREYYGDVLRRRA